MSALEALRAIIPTKKGAAVKKIESKLGVLLYLYYRFKEVFGDPLNWDDFVDGTIYLDIKREMENSK